MRLTLRALAALLSYPSAELKDHVAEVRDALRSDGVLPAAVIERLQPLLQSFERDDLLDLQANYTELFDRSRSLSLHLFEHIHGDSRERGQAMIDLGQQYIDRGFVMSASELPDFLPMFLEFLSCSPGTQAREWLSEPAHVFAVLEQRLSERGSAYAAIFHALLTLPHVSPDAATIAELRDRSTSEEKSIDDEWEDAPVDFRAPLGAHARPAAGVIARIRSARRAVAAAIKR
jgi:nitrate reductase delta subunit